MLTWNFPRNYFSRTLPKRFSEVLSILECFENFDSILVNYFFGFVQQLNLKSRIGLSWTMINQSDCNKAEKYDLSYDKAG